jgi:hypothetical protein
MYSFFTIFTGPKVPFGYKATLASDQGTGHVYRETKYGLHIIIFVDQS